MLTRVPFFGGVGREAVEIEPLGSLTNMTYKVVFDEVAYALRLPGHDTWEYIDRAAEKRNSRIAADAGIGADVLYFDARSGTMVSWFVEGHTMDAGRLGEDAEALSRVARTLRRVHGLGRDFRFRFNVFGMIERYQDILYKLRLPLPASYGELERGTEAARRALEASPVSLVPCHNDPWPSNFIDSGGRIYLIDWEFSGMNDPLWDLADLSVEGEFGPQQDRTMMEAYWRGDPPEAFYSRLELYKAMSDHLWSLWGFIQHANDNPLDDFLTYAQERFGRCEERMDAPDFGRHLDIVRTDRREYVAQNEPVRWLRAE
jgi:thiamine kinase-like enzyme